MSARPRGFTMMELMMVVAIISVISALAAASAISVVRIGRMNAASSSLTRALVDTRMRAMTQRCAHVAQINGTFYAPSSPETGAPVAPGSVAVIRKANCDATGSELRYRGGTGAYDRDRVMNVTILGDESIATRGVRLFADTGTTLFSGTGGELTYQSLAVGYDAVGTATLVADDTGNGSFGTPLGSMNLTVGVTSPVETYDGGTSAQMVTVPPNAAAQRR